MADIDQETIKALAKQIMADGTLKELFRDAIQDALPGKKLEDAVMKGISDWLQKTAAEFGWWSLKCICIAAFCGMMALALIGQGWKK